MAEQQKRLGESSAQVSFLWGIISFGDASSLQNQTSYVGAWD